MLALDSNMVHWLIHILIGLAPNQQDISREARTHLEASREPIENLIKTQKTLCEQLQSITKYVVKWERKKEKISRCITDHLENSCCAALTAEEMFTKQMHQEGDAEKEVLDLKRMQVIIVFMEKRESYTENISLQSIVQVFLNFCCGVYACAWVLNRPSSLCLCMSVC